jgi:hypothetical protein
LPEKAIKEGRELKVAIAILWFASLDHLPAPEGPTDAAEIEAADTVEHALESRADGLTPGRTPLKRDLSVFSMAF